MLTKQIIREIEKNKISTTETADILGKKGALKNLFPLNPGHFRVGEVIFIYAYNQSNWEVHEQIAKLDCKNKIVYIHGLKCLERAILGDLVTKYLFLYKQCKALVVNGYVRDAHRLIKENYPLWCQGVTPIGCHNVKNEILPSAIEINKLRKKFDKGIMVCDDCGVVLIEAQQIQTNIIEKLKFIELQEDIWYFCLDRHKMSTFEIVCQKKYLTESGLIEKKQLLKLSKFSTSR